MLEIQPKQFRLTAEGEILFQKDPTSPLPGKPVARVRKGQALLRPDAEITDAESVDGVKTGDWLQSHIYEVLQPLAALNDDEQIQQPARVIARKLHEALGILPRAALEEEIAKLDEEGRRALRARKVRLGPVLVYLPVLNKPASVRLRALLWNLWHEKPLPAQAPPDGVTSISLEGREDIDPVYFRAIGYPVCGPRAIRADMLDRLVGAIYDSAEGGTFRAKHEMAEWLGCTIPDLYAVIEAMDHKKIHDPAEEQAKKEAEGEEKPAEEKAESETPAEEKPAEDKPAVPQEKPDLATFRLRKGKAYGRLPRSRDKPQGKPHRQKKKPPRKQKPAREREPRERIISAGPKKAADSPFAVLKDMKVQGHD